MIIIKSKQEIECMRAAGEIAAACMQLIKESIKPGVTTLELDEIAAKYIKSQGAKASFKGYGGFPGSICASVNDRVVHGIPSKHEILREGDIVSIDLGAYYKGFHSDMAKTFAVGAIDEESEKLIKVTRDSFYEGLKQAVSGNRVGDIGNAISNYTESRGYGVVRDLVGHGVGSSLHEDPEVPNFGDAGRGPRLMPGMTIAIEPMITMGTYKVKVLDDDWTVVTQDGKNASHHEHTVLITNHEPVLLTRL